MKKKSLRIPIGFLAGFLFIWRADPTVLSYMAGTLIILFGELIRFVSSGTLKKFEGVTRNGMYAYTRNPLYIGSFFLGTGACVMSRDPLFSIVFFLFYIILYRRVILREEKYLVGRYGEDYVRYLEEVPRLIPRKINLSYVFKNTSPALAIKNKEGKTLLGIAAILLIMLVKLIY
ncbi:methyltransferase family protein [Candidatus Latescibacterota bacterium]